MLQVYFNAIILYLCISGLCHSLSTCIEVIPLIGRQYQCASRFVAFLCKLIQVPSISVDVHGCIVSLTKVHGTMGFIHLMRESAYMPWPPEPHPLFLSILSCPYWGGGPGQVALNVCSQISIAPPNFIAISTLINSLTTDVFLKFFMISATVVV